eukprot:Gregarina_sp_Poly_1__5097@NODE_26_length_19795_cov_50_913828_g24_i0_p5_GENE_NODE_26_length_19795_cov_50_913828_g24_i0NODE_26_length_19795_cov_50_913828_g24_i0_p5_ORF_typecomplete_len370_score45_95AIP3/PF03915_13/0_11_NODE_26_length_19795_cov_50_913828_g24_i01818719296
MAVLDIYFHEQFPLHSAVLAKISTAWRSFLQSAEIKHDREMYEKDSIQERQFLRHTADRWLGEFSLVCHREKQDGIPPPKMKRPLLVDNSRGNFSEKIEERTLEEILNQFQKLFLVTLNQDPASSFINLLQPLSGVDEYRKDLATFIKQYRSDILNGVDLWNQLESLMERNLSPDSVKRILAFCGDALEKDRIMFWTQAQSEPVIMRLALMRTAAILSLVNRTEFFPVQECQQPTCGTPHDSHENDFENLKYELKTVKMLSNQLSQARPNYHLFSKKLREERRNMVLEISQLMQNFNPFEHSAACILAHFANCRQKLEKLSNQFGENDKDCFLKVSRWLKFAVRSVREAVHSGADDSTVGYLEGPESLG